MRVRIQSGVAAPALGLAATLGGGLLDTTGAVAGAGRGPDGRDVLAGRATVIEAFRTRAGVPVVTSDGSLTAVERAVLARRVECEAGSVMVLG